MQIGKYLTTILIKILENGNYLKLYPSVSPSKTSIKRQENDGFNAKQDFTILTGLFHGLSSFYTFWGAGGGLSEVEALSGRSKQTNKPITPAL